MTTGLNGSDNGLPACTDREVLDAAGCVSTTVVCRGCGYNLRTLGIRARCPECAKPVAESAVRQALMYAPPQWVQRLCDGASVLIGAHVCGALVGVSLLAALAWALAFDDDVATALLPCAAILGLIGAILGLSGVIALTSPDPQRQPVPGNTSRKVLRYTLLAVVLGLGGGIPSLVLLGPHPVTATLFLLGWLGLLALPILIAHRGYVLARRLNDQTLAESAVGLLVLWIAAGVFFLFMFAASLLGPSNEVGAVLAILLGIGVPIIIGLGGWFFARLAKALERATEQANVNATELAAFVASQVPPAGA